MQVILNNLFLEVSNCVSTPDEDTQYKRLAGGTLVSTRTAKRKNKFVLNFDDLDLDMYLKLESIEELCNPDYGSGQSVSFVDVLNREYNVIIDRNDFKLTPIDGLNELRYKGSITLIEA